MNKKIIIISIISILLVGSLFFLFKDREIQQEKQECEIVGDYCNYENIPSELKYQNPNETIDKIHLASREIVDNYLDISNGNPVECLGYDGGARGPTPEVVNYFHFSSCGEGEGGCGFSRDAITCQGSGTYFVREFSSSFGDIYYGPFEKNY